jgi:hypothetical protein
MLIHDVLTIWGLIHGVLVYICFERCIRVVMSQWCLALVNELLALYPNEYLCHHSMYSPTNLTSFHRQKSATLDASDGGGGRFWLV